MNILFVIKSFGIGGVENVTFFLANKFCEKGHNVGIFAFTQDENSLPTGLDGRIKTIIGNGYQICNTNISLLRLFIKNNKTDIVINQWGLPLIPIKTLNNASKGLKVQIISIFHNDPRRNGRLQNIDNQLNNTSNYFKKMYLSLLKFIFRCVTGYSMRYVYNHSNLYGILSPSYKDNFQKQTLIKNPTKLVVLTNPVTIETDNFCYTANNKKKEIIYVGRLDNTQKCINRILELWARHEKLSPEWNLTIIGDGKDRYNLEELTKKMNLSNVNYEGIQKPRPYYERASILLLTSDFEGFPLVIAECMSFGVVPIVYGSFSAVYDIIENGKDGFIVAKMNGKFNIDKMSECLKDLMQNQDMLNYMAKNAIIKSQQYSIDNIYSQYMKYME